MMNELDGSMKEFLKIKNPADTETTFLVHPSDNSNKFTRMRDQLFTLRLTAPSVSAPITVDFKKLVSNLFHASSPLVGSKSMKRKRVLSE